MEHASGEPPVTILAACGGEVAEGQICCFFTMVEIS
jgi:hypothetical protein